MTSALYLCTSNPVKSSFATTSQPTWTGKGLRIALGLESNETTVQWKPTAASPTLNMPDMWMQYTNAMKCRHDLQCTAAEEDTIHTHYSLTVIS